MAQRKATPTAKPGPAKAGRKPKTWSVTGLSLETKSAVEKAASDSGQSVRAWAEATLRAAAEKGAASEQGKLDEIHAAVKALSSRLDELSPQQLRESVSGHFDNLSGQVSQAADRFRTKAAPALEEMYGRVEKAVEDLWQKSGPVAKEFRDRVEGAAEEFRTKTAEAFDQFRGKGSGPGESEKPPAGSAERKGD